MNIGLFFGSFNPIHLGHLFIANHMAHHTDLDEVWFIVSPQNPFKEKKNLLSEYDRLHLVNLSIEDNPKLRSKDIEFYLPKPSYTIDTLIFLEEKYTNKVFEMATQRTFCPFPMLEFIVIGSCAVKREILVAMVLPP